MIPPGGILFINNDLMRISSIISIGFILGAVTLCSVMSGCKRTEAAEEEVAEIEAAEMQGRDAARLFVGKHWKDTLELQRQLLDSRLKSSEYEIAGKKHCAAAYDSAFVSTLRTVRPDVAAHIRDPKRK